MGGLEQFSVSPRPLGFEFGTKGFGAKGLGPGLDNFSVPVPNSDQSKAFRWKSRQGQCVVPGQVTHDGELRDSIKPVNCDSEEAIRGHWLWTEAGQVIWSEGCQKCIQSHKFNTPVHMHFCQVS